MLMSSKPHSSKRGEHEDYNVSPHVTLYPFGFCLRAGGDMTDETKDGLDLAKEQFAKCWLTAPITIKAICPEQIAYGFFTYGFNAGMKYTTDTISKSMKEKKDDNRSHH